MKKYTIRICCLIVLCLAALNTLKSQSGGIETLVVEFGRDAVDYSPEIFIEIGSVYNQDINLGGSRIGNITRVTTPLESFVLFSPGTSAFYPDLEHEWSLNDTLRPQAEQNPKLSQLKLTYSGIMWLELSIRHRTTGVTFTRGKWVYLQFNEFNDNPNSGLIPSQYQYVPEGLTAPTSSFDVFVPSYPPEFIVFDNITLDHDYNGDGHVTVIDLGEFLSLYTP